MKFKIKVCGLKERNNIYNILDERIDWYGFIFYQHSKRFGGADFIIPNEIPTSKRVGVFVNENINNLINYADKHQLTWIQLHGDEPVEYGLSLKSKHLNVIKVFLIDTDFDFEVCKLWLRVADYFLFDTKGEQRGGNGKTFDWSKLFNYQLEIPFLLSGGISNANIKEALKINHPKLMGFDVNSGVEESPGLKDKNLVNQFLNTVNKI